MDMTARSHGFVFPAGFPPCNQCGHDANDPTHVNPAKQGRNPMMGATEGIRMVAAETHKKHHRPPASPRRSHVYATGYASFHAIPCDVCKQPMGASCHSPGMPAGANVPSAAPAAPGGGGGAQMAAAGDGGYGQIVLVRHAFKALPKLESVDADFKLCALCGFAQDDEVHEYKESDENGGKGDSEPNLVTVKQLARVTDRVEPPAETATPVGGPAFVTALNGKTIITGQANVFGQPDDSMPRELAAAWETASAQNPHFQWIEGRFVEADRPNRNKAAWSSQDLEMGEPTVAHGPLNWLHDERHIIGTIAAAKLVVVGERQAAGIAEDIPKTHIRALAPVWSYIYPAEARQIARASEEKKLWYSMECVSREVACLQEGCSHTQSYRDYMLAPQTRCDHVKQGGNRRFADPSFLGGAIIIPPVRPGWGGANATVMRQAAMLAERQEASLTGLSEEEAVSMVAQIISYATGGTA